MPIVEVGAKFVMPCRFDDDIVVESEVSEWGRTSFTVRHRVLKEGQPVVEGFREARLGGSGSRATGRDAELSFPSLTEVVASLSDPTGATTVTPEISSKGRSET